MRYRVSIGPDGFYYPQVWFETWGWYFIADYEETEVSRDIEDALSGNSANEALNILSEFFHHINMQDYVGPIIASGNFKSRLDTR